MLNDALDLDEALTRVIAHIQAPQRAETVVLADALGRVTAEPVRSVTDLPPFPASAMDGYALQWQPGISTLNLIGSRHAGHPFQGTVGRGECVRIMTGAALPKGCDTVVVQEDCAAQGSAVRIVEASRAGTHIRATGNDMRRGDIAVAAGRRSSAFDIGTMAACGHDKAAVWRKPSVAVFSTGNELQPPGAPLGYGDIYDSNRFAVAALLDRLPIATQNLGVLPDDSAGIASALADAGQVCHLILTSGGVSVGDADLVKSTAESLGELNFWRLKLKPGKPVAFGRIGNALFLGLPGNPVSTIITFLLIAKPALEKLCGMQPAPPLAVGAALTEAIAHKPGREEYQRGVAIGSGDGIQVRTTGEQGSNRMSTFADANCLIRIPKGIGNLRPGMRVDVLPFEGIL